MRIRKDWYVIYEGNRIVSFGETKNRLIETSQIPYAEFDTEAEMLQHIEVNGLIIASHDEELVDAVGYQPEEM